MNILVGPAVLLSLLRAGLGPASSAWEVGMVLKKIQSSFPFEIREVRFTCTAPTSWPAITFTPLILTPIQVTASM